VGILIHIAVCDDEKIMLDLLSKQIKDYYAPECEIKKYEDGERLLEESQRQLFDAIFLDIDMPKLNGMELAEKIRKDNKYVKIVFVTNKEDCVYRAYKYGTFRFIRKNCLKQELPEVLEDLKKALQSENEYITLNTSFGKTEMKIYDITYIEVQNHTVTVHSKSSSFCVNGTITDYESQLSSKGFIRVHKSFLVNFRYIYSIEKKDVIMTDKTRIPLSRNRIDEAKTNVQIFARSMSI
jgi:DNA-binding LytR/AlgR family response regulator